MQQSSYGVRWHRHRFGLSASSQSGVTAAALHKGSHLRTRLSGRSILSALILLAAGLSALTGRSLADEPAAASGGSPTTAPSPEILASPTTRPEGFLVAAKSAMQARDYTAAVEQLDKYLAGSPKPKDADEAAYLKALALHYAGKYAESVEVADAVANIKDSPWALKGLFLKAQSLIQLRKYKEAEEIFESQAARLLGAERKQEIAAVVTQFADALAAKPDPKDVGAPPADYNRAANLYRKVLTMEIGRDLKDEVMFKLARSMQQVNPAQAIADYHAYLAEFDPTWAGPVGSQERSLNQKKVNPPPAGKQFLAARFHLGETLLVVGQFPQARQELEDLSTFMYSVIREAAKEEKNPIAQAFWLAGTLTKEEKAKIVAVVKAQGLDFPKFTFDAKIDDVALSDIAWLIVRTYQLPNVQGDQLEKAVKSSRDFLEKFPNHPRAVQAAFLIGETYRAAGRADQAVAAFEDFIAGKNFKLPDGKGATEKLDDLGKSPAELQDEWNKLALYQIGQIRFSQKQYAKAIECWQAYVTKFPNGPQWSASQMDIINTEFQQAAELVAAKKYDEAKKLFDAFLEKHPLDNRVPEILFIFGQIHYAAAMEFTVNEKVTREILGQTKGALSKPDLSNTPYGAMGMWVTAGLDEFKSAIDEWSKLISRFPGTEQASVALYRTGIIYEEKLHDLDKALESYRKCNFGSCASQAAGRVAVMTQKQLTLTTDRVFRTNEPVRLKLATRNIEKLTVKVYWLDLQSFFHKSHSIGAIEALDIALIQPDKTWEFKVSDYAKYKPLQPEIELPFKEGSPGVCIVNVGDDDLESTTLVVRSDIDLIVKSSRSEALVFAEDMVTGQPAVGVELLFSDGQKMLAAAGAGATTQPSRTGKDGVCRVKFDELKTLDTLRVFATRDHHVAFNNVSLAGLAVSAGLSPKGYLYTDRPAYKPGQSVFVRGIIRHVKDSAYVVPKDVPYLLSITDPQGRLLWQEEKKLSEFGTITGNAKLDAAAPLGTYTLTAQEAAKRQADADPSGKVAQPGGPGNVDQPKLDAPVFSTTFLVQQFQTEKIKLGMKLAGGQIAYFRGETVELEIAAGFYWGQPLADRAVRYVLPDGRQFVEKTDKDGKLKVKFDTTGLTPGRPLPFSATIEGENVAANALAYLAEQAYNATVTPSQPLALAGEPFDVTIKTLGPDGKPVSAAMTLTILRREIVKPDPVLAGVPWIALPAQPSGEVTVKEEKFTTDEKTGVATIKVALDKPAGGEYVLRVAGEDRFKQVVTAQNSINISDADDAVKLRFFAETSTLKVGAKADIRLHSRLDKGLALLTFEGESILDYRVIELKKDYNPIELTVGHQHFPNFTISAAAMAPGAALPGGDRAGQPALVLQTASKPFTVERELKVTVKPVKDVYAPGGEGQVKITVTDQLGQPVKGEMSLALVDEALLAIFHDSAPEILSFFQAGVWRQGEFRIASSAGFRYDGMTHAVLKVYLDEADRLARQAEEGKKEAELRAAAALPDSVGLTKAVDPNSPAENPGVSDEKSLSFSGAISGERMESGKLRDLAKKVPMSQNSLQPGLRTPPAPLQTPSPVVNGPGSVGGNGDFAGYTLLTFGAKESGLAPAQPRQDLPEAGFWNGSVVTDDKGEATVSVPMPEATSQWRLTSRGCTVESLVGEATATVVTRKDFFVEIKAPNSLQAGDKVRLLARVHNLTDYEGDAEIALDAEAIGSSGKSVKSGLTDLPIRKTVKIAKQSTTEVLFDSFDVPAELQLKLTVSAKAKDLGDSLTRSLEIRPWGLEYASQAGGVATGDGQVVVQLPEKQEYTQVWMTVSIGPNLQRAIIDMALGGHFVPVPLSPALPPRGGSNMILPPPPPNWGNLAGSDLLAAVSALEYARGAKANEADIRRLTDRARTLVSGLVVSQAADGSWPWSACNVAGDNWAPTSMSLWALARARQAGLAVNGDTTTKAQAFLQTAFTNVPANDNDARAVILHALSTVAAADFANVNRLYRERNTLSDPAVAYAAAALVNLNRTEMAKEMLDLLLTRAKRQAIDNQALLNIEGVPPGATAHPWLNDRIESTALALLALAKADPNNAKARELAQFLLHQRGCYGYRLAKSNGPAVAALAAWFGQGKFAATEYKLDVLVNDKPLTTIECKADQPSVILSVPADLIAKAAGAKNRVDFRINGKGEYAYAVTLRGFSPELKDPGTLPTHPDFKIVRHYYHAPLEYRGRSLGVESSSPVANLEIGQRVAVRVEMINLYSIERDRYLMVEEPLPAGAVLVEGSLTGSFAYSQITPAKITLFYTPGQHVGDVRYQLVGYSTGTCRVLPTVVRDAMDPARMRVGPADALTVLAPGEPSKDVYVMNDAERFAMGSALFNDGVYDEALKYLAELYKANKAYNERDLARMLLWIYTLPAHYDATQIVALFEVLRERHPDLVIPFDKILVVGKAYRDIGELERSCYIFRAAIDASYINDSNVSAVLQDEGQFLASIDFQAGLWREYPDSADVVNSYFALSQLLYQKAPAAHELAAQERKIALTRGRTTIAGTRVPNKIDMLRETLRLLASFMTLYPENPQAPEAAFSMANAFLELKNYPAVVTTGLTAAARYPKSDPCASFQYLTALGYFWQHDYGAARKSAEIVAAGESSDRDFARYIVGQIYHAEGAPAKAIEWYRKVETLYPDAKEAIDYFEAKRVSLDEISTFKPGEPVELKIKYRNVKQVAFQIYRVDLMKLYLREKSLANVTKVNLSGIKPEAELTVSLGDGKDYVDKDKTVKLPITDEAAYLAICRGDDLFTSGVVMITPLKIEVQEDATSGRVRANVLDSATSQYLPEVHVKAIGSADAEFKSGQTDLRGIFFADGLRGKATVIARLGDSRYAFYRGEKWLGAPPQAANQPAQQMQKAQDVQYDFNLNKDNNASQLKNIHNLETMRRQDRKSGVEAQKAY